MAIRPIEIFNQLNKQGIEFFTGVPDSLLKEFCLCIDDKVPASKHIIAANEGNSIALAAGYHLATGSIPLVYMQNSGLGNAINPLLSLCDKKVYSIPMIVMIGWRGEPGVKDEYQHIKQGEIQLEILNTMDIPFEVISSDDNQIEEKISRLVKTTEDEMNPVVLLVKKNSFEKYEKIKTHQSVKRLLREEALEIIIKNIDEDAIVVSTTGKTSREIFEIREKYRQFHNKDFLTVGSMGHCSSIALGISIAKPNRKVFCIDGDGSMLMHLGSLATIASNNPRNFYHILMNNKVHESVGGQETAAKNIDLSAVMEALNSSKTHKATNSQELKEKIKEILKEDGPVFLEVVIQAGSRYDLGRPTIKPVDNKKEFMTFLKK